MAERALGRAPVIDPLVRSRYEPAGDLVADETATEAVPRSAPAVPAASPRPLARRRVPAVDRPARPRPRTGRAAPVDAEEIRAAGESPVEPTTAPVGRGRTPDAEDSPAGAGLVDARPSAPRKDDAGPVASKEPVARPSTRSRSGSTTWRASRFVVAAAGDER